MASQAADLVLEFLQFIGSPAALLSLIVIILTYFLSLRMFAWQQQQEVSNAIVDKPVYYRGANMKLTSVQFISDWSGLGWVRNILPVDPAGFYRVSILLWGEDVDSDKPFDDDLLKKYCSNAGIRVDYVPISPPRQETRGDVAVDMRVHTGGTQEVIRFLEGLPKVVAGKRSDLSPGLSDDWYTTVEPA